MPSPQPSPGLPGEGVRGKSERQAGGVVRKGFWAVADQGLFAGSNFIVNILLARWLTPREYGAFATAFAAFLGLGVIHTALLAEPMLVFAPQRYRDRHGEYFGALFWGHWIVSLGASAVLAIAGWILHLRGQAELASALYWFALAGPFILLLWLMRRSCYGQFNPRRAAMGGVGYLVLMMLLLALVHHFSSLTIGSALAMIAVSSLAASVGLGIGQVTLWPTREILRDVTAEHLRYGRWATATQILGFIPGNIYYFLLPSMASLEQSGALRALSNLFMPFMQAGTALCLLLIPAFVQTRGTQEGRRLHKLALAVLAGGPLAYWLVVGLLDRPVVNWVYGGKYLADAGLVWIIGLQPVISGACGVYGSLLRAQQKMNAVFWGGLVAAIGAVTLGIAMTRAYGLAGVCWSITITYAMHHVTLWLFSREYARGPRKQTRARDGGPIRALFVHRDLPEHGGVPRCFLYLARGADVARMEIRIASFEVPSVAMTAAFGELGIEPRCLGDGGYIRPARRLRAMIEEEQIDVVVATSFKAYLCAKMATRGRVPVVFWVHAITGVINGSIRRRIMRWLSKNDPIIFVSRAVRDVQLPSGHVGLAEVIHDGVEDRAGRADGNEVRESLGLPQDAAVIAYVAEFVECKDHPVAISAMRELARRGVNAHLLLVGIGELMESVRNSTVSIRELVHFLGVRNDVQRLLEAVDIYIHPGRQEGFGLAVVEAMLARKPVVAARDGAMSEIIESGKTGVLFEPGNARELADQIARLMNDPALRTELGEASRAACLERFDIRRFAGEMTRFLRTCLGADAKEAETAEMQLCAS
jgi:glycosyltransferase involved in cell wall biosynthesis/O-antigen/teichoic acid export membrane protein